MRKKQEPDSEASLLKPRSRLHFAILETCEGAALNTLPAPPNEAQFATLTPVHSGGEALRAVHVAPATLRGCSPGPLCRALADGWLFPSYITAVTAG